MKKKPLKTKYKPEDCMYEYEDDNVNESCIRKLNDELLEQLSERIAAHIRM